MYLVSPLHYNGDEDDQDLQCVLKICKIHKNRPATEFTDSNIYLYISAYLTCVNKLLSIIVNMTAAMSTFEQFDVNCDVTSQTSRW